MLNKVNLMGRLTADPELRSTPNNVLVTTFRIAVDRNYCPKGSDRKTDFFDIVAWNKNAEFVTKHFSCGRLILVNGEMRNKEITDKHGIKKTITEVIANEVHFTGEPKNCTCFAKKEEQST
jgi:single-strand DNA-binding protein